MIGLALGFGLSSPAWLALLAYTQGSARQAQLSAVHFQWGVPVRASSGFCPTQLDRELGGFFHAFAAAYGDRTRACGLVSPVALLAGLATRAGELSPQIKWELGLLVIVLIIATPPSVSLFRWSFRWLPFLHVILALCAAEALRILESWRDGSAEGDTKRVGGGRSVSAYCRRGCLDLRWSA